MKSALLGALIAAAASAHFPVGDAVGKDRPLFEVEASGASYLEPAVGEARRGEAPATRHDSALEAALLHLRRLNAGRYHRDTAICAACCNDREVRHQLSNRGAAIRFIRDALSLIGGSTVNQSWSWNEAAVHFLEEMYRLSGSDLYSTSITAVAETPSATLSLI